MKPLSNFIENNTQSYPQIIKVVALSSALSGFLAGIYGILVGAPTPYFMIAFYIAFIFSTNFIIAQFYSEFSSKMFYALATPTWYCIGVLLVGGGFAEGAAAITNLGFVFIFFRDNLKLRRCLISYGLTMLCGCFLYRDFMGSIFPPYNQPIDDVLTMIVSAILLSLIFNIYKRENDQLIEGLRLNNKELETTTKELEEFTYIASHDLKIPLRNVNSFLNLIEKKIDEKEYDDLSEYLTFAKEGSKQMYALITNILEVSSFSNDLKKNRKKSDLNAIFAKTKKLLSKQYPKAIITSNTLPQFYCNETEIEVLFQNLIHNGLKYNDHTSPSVNIVSILTPTHLQITFTDNGIGIAEEYHEQIFSYFKRLHTNTDYEGTGLGLGLCKKIADSYNGSIEVQSSLGKGSTFIVRLPIV